MSRLLARLFVTLVVSSARYPRRTLSFLALVTVLLGAGLLSLHFETGLLDWLPERDPQVQALDRVIRNLDGITNQELLWLELDPDKAAALGVERITDETAIRAQEELAAFVQARVPEVRYVFGLPHWLKLAAFTSGGEAALPASSFEFNLLWRGVWATQQEILGATIATDERAALLGFVVEGDPLSPAARDLGRRIGAAIDAYGATTERQYDLFRTDLLTPIGLASSMARIDRQLRLDLLWLFPLASLFVLVCLYIAFRSWRSTFLALFSLAVGLVWLYGLMGWLGIDLNLINVALFPLILGSGIDYSIHFLNAYERELEASGTGEATFRAVAERTGVALGLVTLITVGGLFSLVFSGVPGMVELGFLAAFGMGSLVFLVLILPPAFYTLFGGEKVQPYHPSGFMIALMTAIGGRYRYLALGLLVVLTGLSVAMQGRTLYQLDVIQGNFPPRDPVTLAVARVTEGVGGAFPEFIILQGNLADPALLQYTTALEVALQDPETGLGADTRVVGLNRALGSYEVLRDGVAPAVRRFLAAGGSLERAAPSDSDRIAASLTAMHASPVWAPLVRLLSNEAQDLSVLIVMPQRVAHSLEGAQELWGGLERVIASVAHLEPPGISTTFLGYRTMTFLFISTSLYWMQVLFGVSLVLASVLIYLFMGSLRAVAAVALIMLLTGMWWFALLPLFGIYVSVFLIFPIVFIVSIGSDYAVHLLWSRRQGEGDDAIYGVTGKGVLYAALTDAGVFLIFAGMYLVSVAQVMVSIGLAVAVTFLCTILVLPLIRKV